MHDHFQQQKPIALQVLGILDPMSLWWPFRSASLHLSARIDHAPVLYSAKLEANLPINTSGSSQASGSTTPRSHHEISETNADAGQGTIALAHNIPFRLREETLSEANSPGSCVPAARFNGCRCRCRFCSALLIPSHVSRPVLPPPETILALSFLFFTSLLRSAPASPSRTTVVAVSRQPILRV